MSKVRIKRLRGSFLAALGCVLLGRPAGTLIDTSEIRDKVRDLVQAQKASTPSPTPSRLRGKEEMVVAATAAGTPSQVGSGAADRRNELRIAMDDDLVLSVDATAPARTYDLSVFGLGETLTRISHEGSLVPWLAESVRNVDPLTWRVTLRKNAKFWDGTPVTPEAVAAAFRKNWEVQGDADSLISRETEISVVDGATLEFKTPKPTGNFPNQLAYHQFVVHKNGTVMTGPYRPIAYEPGRALTLEPFRDHWMGRPPISRIVITVMSDLDARVNALLTGAVDMVLGLPPDLLTRFSPAAYEITAIPSKRVVFILFNHARSPFDDRRLREATSLALDRSALLHDVLRGHGAVATGPFPPYGGVDVVAIHSTDVARARRLLDDAGWRTGPGGVRAKDGQRLAFTLYSFAQVRVATPLALAIQKQLRPLGYDVTVQEVPDIVKQIQQGEALIAMRGINTLPTGDPYFLLRALLAKGGRRNLGGYFNPRVDELLDALHAEADPAQRQARSREIQQIMGRDVPYSFLVFAPITIVTPRGRLRGFLPGSNTEYLIDGTFSVSEPGSAGGVPPSAQDPAATPTFKRR
jgi:peptide/nickel transport system substrate-binding protein